MNKKEIQAKVHELISTGMAKEDVFTQLTGNGVKDSALAYIIASHVDPIRRGQHEKKVTILFGIMFVQALIAFLVGFSIGSGIGPTAKWVVAAVAALIPLAFAWGFHRHYVGAYNAYILLTLVQLPKSFEGFAMNPVATSVMLAVNLGVLAYVWYVREQLFPGFAFITPKKIKGRYVFAN